MIQASKLVVDEHPLIVLPQLATKLQPELKTRASDGAIFLQQLHYWIVKGQGRLVEGVRWIYNTYEQWRLQFPWMTEWDFRTVTFRLRELKLIKFEQMGDHGRDRTGCYTVNYNHPWFCLNPSDGAGDNTSVAFEDSKTSPSEDCSRHTETSAEISFEKTTDTPPAVFSKLVEEDATPISFVRVEDKPEPDCYEPEVTGHNNSAVVPKSANNCSQINSDQETILNTVEDAGILIDRNPQLKATVLRHTLEQVKAAIAHYRQVVREKGRRKNPPGWLTDCLKGQWWKTANTEDEDLYPEGFLKAYQQLIDVGVVEDVPPSWLSKNMGDIEVRVINPNAQPSECPYGLMWWRDALALVE